MAITLIFVMPFFIKFMGKMGLIGGMAFCLATYYVSNMGFAEYFFVIILGTGLAYCDGVAVFLDKFDSLGISKKRKIIIVECIVFILIIYYRDTFIGNRVITNSLWTTILAFMCCLLVKGSMGCKKVLLLFGKHATNMWLVHVFIYYTYYSDYVYMWKYPAIILCFLIGISLLVSMGLEFLKKLIKYDCFFKWVCLKYERLIEKLVLITC